MDVIEFCPGCGAALGEASFRQEYWVARDRHVMCWCAACHLMCTIVLGALVGTEPEH
ncbi:MAG: hypothetical protein L0H84_00960 [Pseudonocardia sp.]|nr:hypothetical protein [Pseudonocardia sp.]